MVVVKVGYEHSHHKKEVLFRELLFYYLSHCMNLRPLVSPSPSGCSFFTSAKKGERVGGIRRISRRNEVARLQVQVLSLRDKKQSNFRCSVF